MVVSGGCRLARNAGMPVCGLTVEGENNPVLLLISELARVTREVCTGQYKSFPQNISTTPD
jgi:hypothetical protein